MKYKVTIWRKEYREHIFEVDAESRLEAEHKALEDSYDHDFGEDEVCLGEEEIASTYAQTTAEEDAEPDKTPN